MNGRVYWTALAHRDVVELGEYIGSHNRSAAVRFFDAAEASCAMLAQAAGPGSLCDFDDPRTSGMRVWPIHGFHKHLIFDRPYEGGIQVVRVLHSTRDYERVFREPQ